MSNSLVDQQNMFIMKDSDSYAVLNTSRKAGQVDFHVYIVTMIFLIYACSLHNLFSYMIFHISNMFVENIMTQLIVLFGHMNH